MVEHFLARLGNRGSEHHRWKAIRPGSGEIRCRHFNGWGAYPKLVEPEDCRRSNCCPAHVVKSAQIPSNEVPRLEALRRYSVLDTPPEVSFDRITKLAASHFSVPIALVSLIDAKRQWFKSCVGMSPAEVDRKIAFCAHAILSDEVLIVPDTQEDTRFHDNPQVTSAPLIRFYAGAPLITPDGFRLGTLCIVDRVPRTFSPKQAEELQDFAAMVIEALEARRATASMAAAIASTASGVTIVDARRTDLPIVFANPAFCEMTGYSQAEVLGRNCRFLQGFDTDQRMVEQMRAALASRQPFRSTVRNYRKDGTPFWNELTINPVFDDFGELISFVGVQVDATAQVEALEQARRSEARLAIAQQVAQLGSWECTFTAAGELDQRSVVWSDETYRLVGLTPGESVDLWEHFFRCVHPDDVAALNAVFGEAVRSRGRYSLDHRLIRPDGTLCVLHEEASILLDQETGRPLRMVGTMQDITERKKAEAALLESKHFLRSTLDALSSHIAILDEEGTIVEINQAWQNSADVDGLPTERCGIGDNYLCIGGALTGSSDDGRSELAKGIRAIIAGQDETFYLEYPSRKKEKEHWFSVRVTRFHADGAMRIVLAHDNITQRKLAEKDLRWKTAFLEAQVNSSPDGIVVVDSQRQIILQNRRLKEMWNAPQHVREDKDARKQLKWVTGMTKDPARFIEKVTYLYEHPQETSRDEIELKDGRFLDRSSAPVVGTDGTHYGRIWTYRDVTERKQIEESLRESEARYAQIAANIPGLVYQLVLRPDGGMALPFVSRGSLDLNEMEPEEMQHDASAALNAIHSDDQENHRQALAVSAATLEPLNWQGRVLRQRSGDIRYVQVAAKPTRKPNGDIVWDGLVLDITDRKQAEENLRAKEEAERTNKEKSKFLSRMSHELRTPLNAILGFGQVLQFSTLEEQDALALGYILKGGQHLLSLVDEVLDLSRAESGDLHLSIGDVDAREVVDECVGLVERLAEARRITCTVKRPLRPVPLRCDEQRLRQVLLNLLSNAIKYNREGGQVLISFEPRPANRMQLNVTDTGPGLSAESVARLFVPFERLEQENGEVEGTGLGLVVSRRIAEAMDGSIGVKSEAGRGSTFWIELPLAASAPLVPTDLVRCVGPSIPNAEALPGATLLYIEDNLSNLQVMEMLLARQRPHWRFISARDGCKGLALARQELPDLILLDLQMPGMLGEDVLGELRRDPATQEIPVIVLSADATAHSRERLLALGADEYVSKPFQAEPLLELFDRTLGQASVMT